MQVFGDNTKVHKRDLSNQSEAYLFQVPKVYGKGKRKKALVDSCNVLRGVYRPPFWCYLGSVQTVLRSLIKTSPELKFRR